MLLSMILVPLLGALVVSIRSEEKESSSIQNRYLIQSQFRTALFITLLTFLISLVMWGEFDSSSSEYQFTSTIIESSFLSLNLGIDGFSLYFVLLTTFTMPIAILASWESIKHHVKEYLVLLLLLETFLIGVFLVLDLLLFYVFFEAVLIPLFIIVGIWGASENKVRASFLLFLYTLFGSLFMLLAFITIYYNVGTSDMQMISALASNMSFSQQKFLWLAIFLSLAIKTPLVPFHIWLSRAHVEAPLAGSIILAGLILKLATYGFLRVLIPFLPEATYHFVPFVITITVISLIYSSLSTIRQTDFKCLVAYSSVAHIAVSTLALFSNTIQGIEGAILLSIAHGFVSPALFMLVGGVLYDRYHTRTIRVFRGMVLSMPLFAVFFFFFSMYNIATPTSLNWIGELLSLMGIFQSNPIAGALMSTGIILSACYSIWLFSRICYGESSKILSIIGAYDLTRREFMILLTLLIPTVFFGLFPNTLLVDLHYTVSTIIYTIPDSYSTISQLSSTTDHLSGAGL